MIYRFIISLIFLSYLCNAGDNKDSSYVFPEVQVTGRRMLNNSALEHHSYDIISSKEIETSGAIQISDILSSQPSLNIIDYGGLSGMKTVSFRGSPSSQTSIFLNGIKINSPQTGALDLSTLPVSFIESVEVIRGGASAFLGGNSMAGSINFNSKSDSISRVIFSSKLGSFGLINTSGEVNSRLFNIDFNGFADILLSDGNFSFSSDQYGEIIDMERSNADIENYSIGLNAASNVNSLYLNSLLIFRSTNKGVPGPIIQGYSPISDRLSEKQIYFLLNLYNSDNQPKYGINAAFTYNSMNYKNTALSFSSINNNSFFNRTIILNSFYKKDLDFGKFKLNLDNSYTSLNGDFLQPDINNYVDRYNLGISSTLNNYYKHKSYIFNSSIGLRYDILSDTRNSLSGIFGMSVNNNNLPITLKSSVSYDFRPPSLNEMYYFNYGNADLIPENSFSFNLASILKYKILYFEVSSYLYNTYDKIVSIPISSINWNAENIDLTVSYGYDIILKLINLYDIFDLNISYNRSYNINKTINSPFYNKIIPYLPEESINITSNIYLYDFTIFTNFHHDSYRYSLYNNSFASVLPSYDIMDISIIYVRNIFNLITTYRLDFLNIFDTKYNIIMNYPMPGRQVRFAVEFKWEK